MSTKTLDAALIARMFLAGAGELAANKDRINDLNVFPVPDGDTGTNMTLTIMSAAKEVLALGEEFDMPALCKAISMGSLRGARGNSGVILSQLLRGFTKEISAHEAADLKTLSVSFNKACETAYKAVMKPKEGTILTVARGAAEKAAELAEKCDEPFDIERFATEIVSHAEYVLSQTPEMLPVLKQAGVVDSGGQGLVCVLTGAKKALLGEVSDFTEADLAAASGQASGGINRDAVAGAEVKYGYCTEFIIMLNHVFNHKNEADFKGYLESIGDSIVCVSYEDIVKVHVHTNHPGLAFERALTYGALTSMKIDNMREEHQERLFKLDGGKYVERPEEEMEYTGQAGTANGPIRHKAAVSQLAAEKIAEQGINEVSEDNNAENTGAERKTYGFISVSVGEGLTEIFKDLGADEIISGGQTMNPSTDDFIEAIKRVNADKIFILPNNKNIILAANQAASLTEDKEIIVIPTKTIPQGITALISFLPESGAEDNKEAMIQAIEGVKTGEVTYSVRTTNIDDQVIKKGDIMGIGDKGILAVGTDIMDTAFEMVYRMVDEDSSLISIYYGENTDEKDAKELERRLEKQYPDLDVEMHVGGEPVYYYIISVE